LLDATERLYRDANKDTVTIRDIIESVSAHFNVTRLDGKYRRKMKERLMYLLWGERAAGGDRGESVSVAGRDNKDEDEGDGGHDVNDDDDNDNSDDVEVIHNGTSASSPEVIDLVDDDSDDDENDDDDRSRSCFYEYDANGDIRRNASRCDETKCQKVAIANLFDYDSSIDGDDDHVVDDDDDDSDDSSDVVDVTEIMLAKRREMTKRMVNDAEEIYDSDDGEDATDDREEGTTTATVERKRGKVASPKSSSNTTKKRGRPRRNVESTIEVIIDEKDVPTCPGPVVDREDDDGVPRDVHDADGGGVDRAIKRRIVKLLNTGFHGESNENEARNAMRLARRLMERYNLDRAMLMQERGDGSLNDYSTSNGDDDDDACMRGGIVTARIVNRKSGKPLSSLCRWYDFLIDTVCMNFRVEAFTDVSRSMANAPGECSVTFYGIHTNAQLAAYAFKISSERCSLMAASYEPPNKMLLTGKRGAETRNARLSYALGIVNGLERDVKDGLWREEERRKEKLRRAKNASRRGESYHQDDDSDIDVGEREGVDRCKTDDNIDTSDTTACHLEKLERENTAHLALIDHHKRIASDVLKVSPSIYVGLFIPNGERVYFFS
jgi:hypothetical protein